MLVAVRDSKSSWLQLVIVKVFDFYARQEKMLIGIQNCQRCCVCLTKKFLITMMQRISCLHVYQRVKVVCCTRQIKLLNAVQDNERCYLLLLKIVIQNSKNCWFLHGKSLIFMFRVGFSCYNCVLL